MASRPFEALLPREQKLGCKSHRGNEITRFIRPAIAGDENRSIFTFSWRVS